VEDVGDLATKEHADEVVEMVRAARSESKAKYTIDRNYDSLIHIYRDASA
jgi:hypothetical protein